MGKNNAEFWLIDKNLFIRREEKLHNLKNLQLPHAVPINVLIAYSIISFRSFWQNSKYLIFSFENFIARKRDASDYKFRWYLKIGNEKFVKLVLYYNSNNLSSRIERNYSCVYV